MKLKPKYSGGDSKKFWLQVNRIKDKNKRDQAYTLGVLLQNFEEDVLRLLNLLK